MSARPRLAIVIPTLHGAGAERFLSEILPRLDEAFEIDLILYAREIDYPVPPGVNVVILGGGTSAERSVAHKGARFARRVAALARHLRAGRFDVVFGLVDMNNVVTWAAARMADRGLPVVLAERTINENFFAFNPHARRMAKVMRPLLRLAYGRADRVVALSQAMRRYLEGAFGVRRPAGKPMDVVENGVNLGAFFPPPGPEGAPVPDGLDERFRRAKVRVLNVARLDDNKDQAFLVDLFSDVRREVPGAELFVIGQGPNEAALRARIAAAGLDGAVHLLGWRTDVPDYMRAASTFVLSSHHEGTPRTVIESLACGLPVVVTRSTESLPDVLEGDLGALVPVGDRAAFTAALIDALRRRATDPAHRRAIAAAARARFDITARANDYVRLLGEAAAARTPDARRRISVTIDAPGPLA